MSTRGGGRALVGMVALCTVQFVDVLGVTAATTALPVMTADLAAPEWSTGVLATVYAAFFGGFLILGARLGDLHGHRRVLLAGLVLFTAVVGIGASAHEVVQLVVARALQGAAAAISVPSALRLLLHLAPEDRRSTAVAAWGASGAAAGALGFLAGGFLTDAWGWRSIYWINLPIGLVLLVAVTVAVTPLPVERQRRSLDLPGAVLLVVAIMAVVVGASMVERVGLRGWGTACIVLGLLIGAAFLLQQRRAREPLVPRRAWGDVNLRTGTVVSFVNTAVTSSAGVLVTLHLQRQRGASPIEAGLTLLPFSLAVIGGSVLAARLAPRVTGRHSAAIGLSAVAVGTAVLAATHGRASGILAGVVLAGIGLGIAAVAATSVGTDVPDQLAGSAAGILNTGAQVGTAVGVAALVALATGLAFTGIGASIAWALGTAVAAATALALVLRHPRHGSEPLQSRR